MKDNLEQLVNKNREAFDGREPSGKVWKRISKQLDEGSGFQWIWKAAAIVFFITTVGLVVKLEFAVDETLVADETNVTNDFEAVESFYIDLISEKKSLIYDFEEKNTSIDQGFEHDLQKLDAMYQVLKEEVLANPSKKVVDALILNLLVRIDILNVQLQELDRNPLNDGEVENPKRNV